MSLFQNTEFHNETLNPSGSHYDRTLQYLPQTSPLGIVSLGQTALTLAQSNPDHHIFLPIPTPPIIIQKLYLYTANIHLLGNSYNECLELASTYMFQNEITNITPGIIQHPKSNIPIIHEILSHSTPKYIFVPSINFNLASDICESIRNYPDHDTTIIACVLPDHFLSPRYNFKYNKLPYYSSIVNDEHRHTRPSLSTRYKYYPNIIINTVHDPDTSYSKYYPHYPYLDPLNYISMEISTQYPLSDSKVIIISGINLQEPL